MIDSLDRRVWRARLYKAFDDKSSEAKKENTHLVEGNIREVAYPCKNKRMELMSVEIFSVAPVDIK